MLFNIVEVLSVNFMRHCGYRICCEFDTPVPTTGDVRLYSDIFPTPPKDGDTVAESRENFRTALRANGIFIEPTALYIAAVDGLPVRSNAKVRTLRKQYQNSDMRTILNALETLQSARHGLLRYLLDGQDESLGIAVSELKSNTVQKLIG